jgi:hypothetical protein
MELLSDRIAFLAEKFDVFECSNSDKEISDIDVNLTDKLNSLNESGYITNVITDRYNKTIAILSNQNGLNRHISNVDVSVSIGNKVSICSEVFFDIVSSDPTENKINVQWMLNLFFNFLKDGDTDSAIRFVNEDLPQANKYLTLFEANKRKRLFRELSLVSNKDITDPRDINQYKSLSSLFEAVDPFIEREPSSIERSIERFVKSGKAIISVRDRNYTVFIPKSLEASELFGNYASWCTARKGNSNFKSYTTSDKKPNGKDSELYIVINNKFFTGESRDIYQIHFETNQLKDKNNAECSTFYEDVLCNSSVLDSYFYSELITMAKEYKNGIDSNKYLDFLINFGYPESLFDLFDVDIPSIRLNKRKISRVKNLERFKNVQELSFIGCSITDIDSSIGELSTLEMLILYDNQIAELPSSIGNLKNLVLLNLMNNPKIKIPDDIGKLDKENGGSLHRLIIRRDDITSDDLSRLEYLLPSTQIVLL